MDQIQTDHSNYLLNANLERLELGQFHLHFTYVLVSQSHRTKVEPFQSKQMNSQAVTTWITSLVISS